MDGGDFARLVIAFITSGGSDFDATFSPSDLAPGNVSLVECLNSREENGNDENIKGALHARIQARGSATGGGRTEHCGSGALSGGGQRDTVQLGQGTAPRLAPGC